MQRVMTSKRVLVAVDETDDAKRVADFVNRFFSDMDVEILAVNVARSAATWIPPTIGWAGVYGWGYTAVYPDPALLDADAADDAEKEALRAAERVVRESKLEEDEIIAERGDVAATILRAASEHDVDLIVVGTSDKSILQRLVSPSVSRELVGHADRPVLVVR
jgi:nucleotide-binding universal stress UspA family protein